MREALMDEGLRVQGGLLGQGSATAGISSSVLKRAPGRAQDQRKRQQLRLAKRLSLCNDPIKHSLSQSRVVGVEEDLRLMNPQPQP